MRLITRSAGIRTVVVALIAGAWLLDAQSRRPGELEWRFTTDDDGVVVRTTAPEGMTRHARRATSSGESQVGTTRPDGSTVVIDRDRLGRRVRMTDPSGSATYRYDAAGRLTWVRRGDQPPVAYTYNALGRVTSIAAGDYRVAYQYDASGRVIRIEGPRGPIADYTYHAGTNRVVRRYANGVTSHLDFAPNNDLTALTHVSADSSVLARFRYTFRPDGLVARADEYAEGTSTAGLYEYDTSGRLISHRVDGRSTTFNYDRRGNLLLTAAGGTQVRSTFDWADRLVQRGDAGVRHDAAGNLVAYHTAAGERRFTFGADNHLTSATSGGAVVSYTYDGDGLLVERAVGNEKTTFISDPLADEWRPLLAIDSQGRRTFYVWDEERLVAESDGDRLTYFLTDHLDSIRAAVSDEGNVVRRDAYGPYGESAGKSGGSVRPAFAGMFFDPVAGLYLLRHRAFDPGLARFLQRDPLHRVPTGSQKDLSPYGYCGNDPVNFIDRTGAEPEQARAARSTASGPMRDFEKPKYRDAVTLGLGSGARSDAEILRETQRRFQMIDLTASGPHGGLADFGNYAVTGGRGPQGQRHQIDWSADQIVAHSAGNHIVGSGPNVIRMGASEQQALPSREIYHRDIVSDLTTAEFSARGTAPSVGFSVKFGSNPLEAVPELARDAVSFARGVTSLATRIAAYPVTRESPFAEHSYVGYQNELDRAGKLKPEGTYDSHIQINRRDGTTHYSYNPATGKYTYLGRTPRPTSPGEFPDTHRVTTGASSAPVSSSRPRSPLDTMPDVLVQPIGLSSSTARAGDGPTSSKVGGVDLRGASQALSTLGALSAVAIDPESGELILLSKVGAPIELPPLRVEDVATIFRNVYQHGEAPWVSIDPDPSNPRGPTMVVRHGTQDRDSYVAWILFEADRLMKAYSLGQDNVTKSPVQSNVDGYQSMLDVRGDAASNWQRFWIRPAAVERRESTGRTVTLTGVRLMVDTETMVLRGGRLASAPNARPSTSARAFASWFTERYDAIAAEVASRPPGEQTRQVAVFQELRRIAVIAAAAEALRNQGVPFPQWMANVPIHRVPEQVKTPATFVRRESSGLIRQIYGGATLSPADGDVRVVSRDYEADAIARAVLPAMRGRETFTPVTVSVGADRYAAVAMPGNEASAVGAAQLAETDAALPLGDSLSLDLTRYFNSFITDDRLSPFGSPWTMDLPRLERMRRPVRRTRSAAEYEQVYTLTSPYETPTSFSHRAFVPQLGELLVPATPSDVIGLASSGPLPEAPAARHRILFKDGHSLYFDDGGTLVAWTRGGAVVAYVTENRRLVRIAALTAGGIKDGYSFHYEAASGRLVRAVSDSGTQVSYSYDGSGRLVRVRGPLADTAYEYTAGRLSAITRGGRSVRTLSYSPTGQLVREVQDGRTRTYRLERGGDRTIISVDDGTRDGSSYSFDHAGRPLHQQLDERTAVDWTYGDGGAIVANITRADGLSYAISRGADGVVTLRDAGGREYRAWFDAAKQSYQFTPGTQPAESTWQIGGTGLPLSMAVGDVSARFQYGAGDRLIATAIGTTAAFRDWIRVTYDENAQPSEVEDSTGYALRIARDGDRRPTELSSSTSRVVIARDGRGAVTRVDRSWGERGTWTYDRSGVVTEKMVANAGARTRLQYRNGLLTRVNQFDGGQMRLAYDLATTPGFPSKVVMPSGLELEYSYDGEGRVRRVVIDRVRTVFYEYDDRSRVTKVQERQFLPHKRDRMLRNHRVGA